MKIYHYDPITKELAGSSDARLDPLESKKQGKDIFLIPANATTGKPPKPKENEVVIIDKAEWICVPKPEKPEEIPHIETLEEIKEREKEVLIKAKIREIAIEALKKEGKLASEE